MTAAAPRALAGEIVARDDFDYTLTPEEQDIVRRVLANEAAPSPADCLLVGQFAERFGLGLATSADDPVTSLNRHYAFVLIGGQQSVLAEDENGGSELLTIEAFKGWLASQPDVPVGKRYVPLATAWLKHPARRSYRRIVFRPETSRAKPDEYNLWKGFAVRPSTEGSCDRFLHHLTDNLAQGNPEHARWILGWFAQLVQQPAQKPGTALVLRGPQGVGKTITGDVLRLLLGRHYIRVAAADRVVGRFNAHLKHALVLHADEGFFAGDHAAESKLKDLITSDTQFIEFKGKEAIEVDNYVRLLVTSNREWVVPAAFDERRFAVFDVGEEHQQDRSYFRALWQELTSQGGKARLLDHLLHVDLSKIDLGVIPQTAALTEQKLHNLDSEAAWLLDVLQRGILPGDEAACGRAPRTAVHDAYIDHAKRAGVPRRAFETKLGMFLRRILRGSRGEPLVRDERPLIGERQERIYCFPALSECRAAFERALHTSINWRDPSAWSAWASAESQAPKESWR